MNTIQNFLFIALLLAVVIMGIGVLTSSGINEFVEWTG